METGLSTFGTAPAKKCAWQDSDIIPVRGPATKRIQAQIQFGYNFIFIWITALNLAILGSIIAA
jgi:hypothetical protein